MKIPQSVEDHIHAANAVLSRFSPRLAQLYRNCYPHTIRSALQELEDGNLFVLTGDIPAMWLRDSAAQVSHYLPLAADPEVADLIRRVLMTQFRYIQTDPYANAFNAAPNGKGHIKDKPRIQPWVFERKYEVDSLCYPIRLCYRYWQATADRTIIRDGLEPAMRIILNVWRTEQHHMELSPYWFVRQDCPLQDSLRNVGRGTPVGYTGMTWSGFRPSDDACSFGYLIPSNMFAVVVLGYAAQMLGQEHPMTGEILALQKEIDDGIRRFGIVDHPWYGQVYACEVDGLGHHLLMDDANIPSLISAPYLGYIDAADPLYQRTRRMLLSPENPYYYEGTMARGIGSPHTPPRYIWHLALSMQGLTSRDPEEKQELLHMLETCDGRTGFMHEGFFADDPSIYTRPWFTWSDSLFCEFVDQCMADGTI